MISIDGIKGSAAVAAMWCGRPRERGVSQRRRLQRTSAPSHIWCGAWAAFRRTSQIWATQPRLAGVIEGRPGDIPARSDLSPSSTLTGQRSYRMAPYGAHRGREADKAYGPAAGRRNLLPHCPRNLGNPCAEKVWPHRSRQTKGAAPLTKAPSAFRRIGGAVRQGTLTITGSNVRLGTEMPVALSSFSL